MVMNKHSFLLAEQNVHNAYCQDLHPCRITGPSLSVYIELGDDDSKEAGYYQHHSILKTTVGLCYLHIGNTGTLDQATEHGAGGREHRGAHVS